MFGVIGTAVSPDQRSLYVAAHFDYAIHILDRAPDGTFAQIPGADGCLAHVDNENCTAFGLLWEPNELAMSPDGRHLYVTARSYGLLAGIRRDTAAPTCSAAPVTTAAGTAVDIQLARSDADGHAVSRSIVSAPAGGTLGEIDQATGTVRFTPAADFSGTTSFTFRATANDVESPIAAAQVTVQAPPATVAPPPVVVTPPPTVTPPPGPTVAAIVRAVAAARFRPGATSTRVLRLDLVQGEAGARVTASCIGRGCPFRSAALTRTATGLASATRRFGSAALRPGARIQLRVTKAGTRGRSFTYTIRRSAAPTLVTLCIPVAGGTPVRC